MSRLPLGAKLLDVPTYLCAAIYIGTLCLLLAQRDSRLFQAALVPAAISLTVTVLCPMFNRRRPYDAFGIPPVGKWEPGKRKSMPSRHAASAAAIALAVMWVYPSAWVILFMSLLCALISALRVLSGKHYPSDVLAALLLAGAISYFGYSI